MRKSGTDYQARNPVWLLFIGTLVLFLPVYFIIRKVQGHTGGLSIYPYDDTYIHLQIADTLLKGNWGITENEFASASSSILYTLILAAGRILTTSTLLPLIVNFLAGLLILVTVLSWLKRQGVGWIGQATVITLVIFLTPLPLLITSGMEHTLQCLFSFLFLFYFSDWLEESIEHRRRIPARILLYATLTATIRYEGLFLIAMAAGLLLLHRRFRDGIFLVLAAGLPLVVFGLISVYNGNYFIPNSVLVKSQSVSHTGPLQMIRGIFFEKLMIPENGMASLATQRLAIAIPVLYFLFRKFMKPSYGFILIGLFGAVILQLAFASTGYLYRYESYLFFCFMIIAPVLFFRYGRELLEGIKSWLPKLVAIGLAFFLCFPFFLRAASGLQKTVQASVNIYEQQYQMTKFVGRYYDHSTVALNDIGAVSYFTNARVVDLWGLADIEVTRSKKGRYWTPEFIDSFSRKNATELAIIYDVWFSDSLTSKWQKVATWQISNNVICGDDVVSFYAIDSASRSRLSQNLREFEPQLPRTVGVRYY